MRAAHLTLFAGLAFALAPTCQGDDTDEPAATTWFQTCGDPVCQGYTGPFDGVVPCADDGVVVGDTCGGDEVDSSCDPVDDCNALLICTDSDPTQEPGGCPISLRKHKDGIRYLGASDRARASEQLLKLKLATWRYTGDLDDGVEHLGFLIDDVPGSAAVRPDGQHVDLYGYTSLAVAAIQEQQAKIETLEARLAALEQQCGEAR